MKLVDSHCHLNYEGLADRQDEVLANARARGVSAFLNISTRQSEWDDVIAVADRNEDVWARRRAGSLRSTAPEDFQLRRLGGDLLGRGTG